MQRAFRTAAALVALTTLSLGAQDARTPISIGDYPDVNGLRINFRDSNLGRVNGMNITVWAPYEPMSGRVRGIALGLPMTGAEDIDGLATGLFGAGAGRNLTGLGIAPIGLGAGKRLKGIAVGGIGVGTGGDLEGIIVGGIGAGAGGNATGAILGGIGAGVAGSITGVAAGLIGVGAGGAAKGVLVGGIGAGVAGDIRGLAIGGIGVGAGGDARAILLGGIGVGVGGTLRGLAVGGVGVGAREIIGVAIAGAGVGGERVNGLVITPGALMIENEGEQRGLSINALGSRIRGTQHGVVIGLVNYARSVDGLQVGLINIIDRAKSHPVLPIVNWQE